MYGMLSNGLSLRKSVEEQEGMIAGEVFGKVFEGVVASWKKCYPNLKFKKAIFARQQIKDFFKKVSWDICYKIHNYS